MTSQKNTPYHEPPSPSPSPPRKAPSPGPLENPSSQKRKWPKQPPLSHRGGGMIEVDLSAPALDLWDWGTIDEGDIGQMPENQNPGMVGKVFRAVRGVGRSAVGKVGGWVTGVVEKEQEGEKEEGECEEGRSSLSPFLSETDSVVLVDRRKLFDWCPGYHTMSENTAEEKTKGHGTADPH